MILKKSNFPSEIILLLNYFLSGTLGTPVHIQDDNSKATIPLQDSLSLNILTDDSLLDCMSDQFRCSEGTCIPMRFRCDFIVDCTYSEDELGCEEFQITCPLEMFQCDRTRCIMPMDVCDSFNHCNDFTDEINCTLTENICDFDEFQCVSDGKCIPDHLQCNKEANCGDISDEINCGTRECDEEEERCEKTGYCIKKTWVCDGQNDCVDNSDEMQCNDKCVATEFRCEKNNICLPQNLKCDGNEDCEDGSDENDCPTIIGTPLKLTTNQPESNYDSRIKDECDHLKSFLCDDVCVPLHWKCDGVVDCSEGIDENGCIPINGDVTTITNQFSTAPIEDENENDVNLVTYESSVSPPTTDRENENEVNLVTFETSMSPMTTPASSCDHIFDSFKCNNTLCIPFLWVCDNDTDCGDGSDEENCEAKECRSTEFQCSGGTCIPLTWKCDNENDCIDGRDEDNCTEITCSESEFLCKNNVSCITKRWICDGEPDCSDASDEENCEVTTESEIVVKSDSTCGSVNEFMCASDKKCIPKALRCNRMADCNDISDELNCGTRECTADEKRCKNTEYCVFNSWICDGRNDCIDNSDEVECKGCSKNQFACSDGLCIEESSRCDKMIDCSDGSDEENCSESNITVTVSTLSTTQSFATYTPPLCSSCITDKKLSSCPAGYEMMKDKCIKVHVFPRRWLRAKQMCQSQGGNQLVVNNNDGTRENLVQFLEETSLKGWNYWIDVLDSEAVKMTVHVVVIPSWFTNGRTCEVSSMFPKYADNCYFLHYRDSLIYKGTNCNDNAGFICEINSS